MALGVPPSSLYTLYYACHTYDLHAKIPRSGTRINVVLYCIVLPWTLLWPNRDKISNLSLLQFTVIAKRQTVFPAYHEPPINSSFLKYISDISLVRFPRHLLLKWFLLLRSRQHRVTTHISKFTFCFQIITFLFVII